VKNLIRQILREESQGFKAYDTVINPYMRKKFPWWIELETSGYSYGETNPTLLTWHATLKVDKDWYDDLCNQSRFSDCDTKDGVRMTLLVDYDVISDVESYLKRMYSHLTGEKKKVKIANSIKVIPVDNKISVNESDDKNSKLKEKIIDLVFDRGLFFTMKMLGLSWSQLVSMIGTEYITKKIMMTFIDDFMRQLNMGFGLVEAGEDPIFYGENDKETMNIVYFGLNSVAVEVIEKAPIYKVSEFRVNYYNLSDDMLMEVFDAMMRIHEDGDIYDVLGI
jgi:hypothetical protein